MTVGGGDTGGQPDRSRRTLLKQTGSAALAAVTVATAGCQGDDSGSDGNDSDGANGEGEAPDSDGGETTDDEDGETTATDDGGPTNAQDGEPPATDDGEERTNTQFTGEKVVSETVPDNSDWEVDLEAGETLAVRFDGNTAGTAEIHPEESVAILASTTLRPEGTQSMQYTAEESGTYRVSLSTLNDVHVEIFVDSA